MVETSSKPTRKVVPTILGGFILALIEMGLPMIGVTVNLWLGGLLLAGAFALFAWGLWNFETNRRYGRPARIATLVLIGLLYFGLMGYQIHAQYKKDHPKAATGSAPNSQTNPDCKGNTGDAKASDGSIANTGNCVHDLSTDGKSKGGGGTK